MSNGTDILYFDLNASSLLSAARFETRKSNRLKYRFGFGSRNFIFNSSVPVQVQDFKNLGLGSVRLHQNLKVRVRFGFIETKF